MNNVKEKAPSTAATVQSAKAKVQDQNSTDRLDCKARAHGRFYTEAEVNADLDKFFDDHEITPLARHIFVELGKRGLLDAFLEVVDGMPDDYESDPIQYFECAVNEAYRRVSA